MAKSFKLTNGALLLSTEAPGGLYSSEQLRKIAEICDAEGGIIKASEDQRLLVYVSEDKAQQVGESLLALGLGVRHYQDGLHQAVACIGELCPQSEQDAMSTALDLSKVLADIMLESPLKIGINGCATCCVPCHTLDIAIIGEAHGYRVSLGGKNSQIPEMAAFMAEGVPANELPNLIKNVIEIFKATAQEGESLQQVIERAGSTAFVKALAPYSQDAASTTDDLFSDLGEPEMMPPEEFAASTQPTSSPSDSMEGEINLDDLPEAEEIKSEDLSDDFNSSDSEMDAKINSDLDFSSAPDIDPNADGLLMDDPTDIPIRDELSEETLDEMAIASEVAEFDQIDEAGNMAEEVIGDSELLLADDDDFESQLEEKLEVSIAEQQTLQETVVDENSNDRMEALGLVESSKDSPEPLQESLIDLDIDDVEFAEDDVAIEDLPSEQSFNQPSSGASSEEFKELEIVNGKLNFVFANGATLSFKVDHLKSHGGSKTLRLDGKEIRVLLVKGGVQVEVDGIEAFVPNDKVAA